MERGRIDIQLEVVLMSQYQMSPREENLEAIYLIFHFLWNNPNRRLAMEPSTTMMDEIEFHSNTNWVESYGDVAEEDTPKMPEPLGFQEATEYCRIKYFWIITCGTTYYQRSGF